MAIANHNQASDAAAGAPGLDDGPSVHRAIDVASTAGTSCTFAKDITGTLPVDVTCCMTVLTTSAASLALHATINTTSGCQLMANANADNNDIGIVVPPELVPPVFAGDGARQRDT